MLISATDTHCDAGNTDGPSPFAPIVKEDLRTHLPRSITMICLNVSSTCLIIEGCGRDGSTEYITVISEEKTSRSLG